MTSPNDLVRDPLFQVNAVLWMAVPLPENASWNPLLSAAGFQVYAIAPLLGPPLDVLSEMKARGITHQERYRPDVVLNREYDRSFAVMECKGRSFGIDSSTARQATTHLIICGPRLHESLGLADSDVSQGAALYVTPESDRVLLDGTLRQLKEKLLASLGHASDYAILGLEVVAMNEEMSLNLTIDTNSGMFLGLPDPVMCIASFHRDTDPRPLYLVPYDPDCDQSPEERAFCKRVLYERVHSEILGAMGRAHPPEDIRITPEDLLRRAMPGVYDKWENADSMKHMRGLVRDLLKRLVLMVNAESKDTLSGNLKLGWTFRLSSPEAQVKVCNLLARFSIEKMDLEKEPEPGLFDDF